MSFEGTATNWWGSLDPEYYTYIAKNCTSYDEIMRCIGYKYTLLCELDVTIKHTVDNWLQHNNKVMCNTFSNSYIFLHFMRQFHKRHPALNKINEEARLYGWSNLNTAHLDTMLDDKTTGLYGSLPVNIQLQFYNALVYQWETIETGEPLRYREPSIMSVSTDDKFFRLEPGGTRVLFASLGDIRHDFIFMCPNHLVDRYYPDEAERNTAIVMAKAYIDRKLLHKKHGRTVKVSAYRGDEIPSFNENPTYNYNGLELRSTLAMMKTHDKDYRADHVDRNRYKIDMAALSCLEYTYENRTMTLSDGTVLFTIADDYGIHINIPVERPKLWLAK